MFPPLYAILDVEQAAGPASNLPEILIGAGVELLQIRDKRASARTLHLAARKLVETYTPRGVRIIVNDRPDIAAMVGAGGVHVGQEDLPVGNARRICGRSLWVGVSTHNLEQFREAAATSADYIALGPVFPTGTKEHPDPVVGLELLRAVRKLTKKPLVAIGGITVESAGAVFGAGADSVAVVRDLVCAADPAQRVKEYLAIAERTLGVRRASRRSTGAPA